MNRLLCLLIIGLFSLEIKAEDGPAKSPEGFDKLTYRSIGPGTGGRVSRVFGVPGDPLTYYAATAGGGVWKSTDGGVNFKPIFDDQPCQSIGSIAVSASDPNVVYVGTGEANIRGNCQAGIGIFKSTDAGKTWKHVWKQIGHIGTMAVHPKDPDIAFAAVLGHAFGPNTERGVYRTTDGGKTWSRVLFKDVDTGASDVCIDPNNPRVVFAGLWQTRRKPWDMTSGGPGSGLYVSRDGGDTWDQIGLSGDKKKKKQDKPKEDDEDALPPGPWGKIGVAIAPSNSSRVYASIEADKGGLFISNDNGATWTKANGERAIRQRAWYYSTITVDPANPDVLWMPQVNMLKSIDAGKTFTRVPGMHHGDNHDLWIDQKNPKRMIGANDGGVDISTDGGNTWFFPPLPIAQFYHVNVDEQFPYRVMGCMQDVGTASGPSNSLKSGGIFLGDWKGVGGGETGFSAPDPTDPAIIYSGEYGGIITRHDARTGQSQNISIYPFDPSGHGAEDLRIRFQWTAPILISQFDNKVVYHAGNHLYRTSDGGKTWQEASPDLTRNDRAKMKWAGGPITGDNTGVEVYGTIFALAESPKQKGLLWTGSDDGLVYISKDDGKTWTNVTTAIPDMPDWATIVCIEASPHDAGTAYVAAEAHRLDNYKPYLWVTTDFGKTWKAITEGLDPEIFLHAVREDPKRKGLLYLGTERGVQISFDAGETWDPLQLNLPSVAVVDLQVKLNDLVLATNGRSFWILDDLTALREWKEELEEKKVYLFSINPAIRWRLGAAVSTHQTIGAVTIPRFGAIFQYYLKEKPKKPPTLEIKNATGQRIVFWDGKNFKKEKPDISPDGGFPEIKTPEIPGETGVNRFVWDLTHAAPEIISKAKVDAGDPSTGPLVAPGTYTVTLTIDKEVLTGKFEVWADPRLSHTGVIFAASVSGKLDPKLTEQLQAQEKFSLQLRDDISKVSGIVGKLRAIQKQLKLHREILKDEPAAKDWVKSAGDLASKLDTLEQKLHNPKAQVGYDILAMRGGAKLYSQLINLYEAARETDGAPTQGVREVTAEMEKELVQLATEWEMVLKDDVAKLNELAQKIQTPKIYVPRP